MTKDLILVAVSLFTWGLGEGIFIYFQPLYLQKLGASPVAIGGDLRRCQSGAGFFSDSGWVFG